MTAATPMDGDGLALEAKRASATGNHDEAVELQSRAVERFEAEYEAARTGRDPAETDGKEQAAAVSTAAHTLADHYGRLGGILRRAGRPQEALESYTAGAALEDEHRLDDSYNRTNRVVLTLLTGSGTPEAMRPEIRRVAAVVQSQVERTRRFQWWAWADLGLLNLLDGNTASALSAYDHFREAGARPNDYRSTLSVLRELRAALTGTAPGLMPAFAAAEDRLERRHGVFISHSRSDAPVAAAVAAALAARLGDDHVFLDLGTVAAGHRAMDAALRSLQRSAVMVLLVGDDWSTPDAAVRLADRGDWTRREVVAARAAGLRVVPVQLDDADPLSIATLPPELQFLGNLTHTRLRRDSAESDVAALVDLVVGSG